MSYRITPDKLDVTVVGGAVKRELEYATERAHLPLRKKYRPSRGKAAQWGHGGDYSGRHQTKVPSRRQEVEPTHRRVMVMGPTGKKSWTWERIPE